MTAKTRVALSAVAAVLFVIAAACGAAVHNTWAAVLLGLAAVAMIGNAVWINARTS